ncbi:MAG: sugar ABC transporter permease [Spirochaetaceae bacterium]|nr:sugar ABC transporter permease [Spirochaetaceae bacterium]
MKPRSRIFPYSLITPAMVITILIIFIPMFRTLTYSLTNYILWKPAERGFAGLENYRKAFTDPIFLLSLKNTVIWIVVIITGQFLLGLGTALLLNRDFIGRGVARSLILIPWVTPSVITALMWRWMYDGNQGVINEILVRMGILDLYFPFLANSHTALWAIMFALLWQGFPFFAIMILAGLQSIPNELYEASEVDGAGRRIKFFRITLPMLKPVILTTILLRTIWVANSLDIIFIMTGGGPGYSTHTLPVYSYIRAYKGFDFGYSSAIAVLLTIFLIAFVAVYIRSILKDGES